MGTRVLCRVHKTGRARPGLGHPALVMAMKCVKVAGRVTWIDRGSEVARLFKVVNTRVGRYVHQNLRYLLLWPRSGLSRPYRFQTFAFTRLVGRWPRRALAIC